MYFRVLGPLEVAADGQSYEIGSPRERCLLAVLLCAEGIAVSADTLIGRVWDERPPPSAMATLQSHVSRLRGRLRVLTDGQVQIRYAGRSYTLLVDPNEVDLWRFRRLRSQARAVEGSGDIERASVLLREAEALWHGQPLAEFTGSWALAIGKRLAEDLRQVKERRIQLELDLGHHADLVGELYELVTHDPDPEPYAGQLMLALHRSGRNGEALAVYRETHRRLSEELGSDPGTALSDLHQRILRRDPELFVPAAFRRPPLRPSAAPDNLPRDLADFTGRHGELRELLANGARDSTAPAVTVVHGMGGVGKTALVTHAAHRLRDRYPDGRFHLDLRAHRDQPPVAPSDALAILLLASGLPVDELPAGVGARAALWRERMAYRSALIVLDDARDPAQVRPLLPGVPTCRVFVTSRRRLADLEGTASLSLDVPDTVESAALFTRIAGPDRTGDTGAVRRVVELCGHHPLAIRLTANRFRHRDSWEVPDLVEQLTRAGHRLDQIGPLSAVASAFEVSYTGLSASVRHLFRTIALHPGPDFTLHVACAAAGLDVTEVQRGLADLLEAHLVEEPVSERYRLHDLVREFAVQAWEREGTAGQRRAATHRILDYYLVTADRADRLAHPQRRRLSVTAEYAPLLVPVFGDPDTASTWLDLNRGNVLAAARLAVAEPAERAVFFPHVLDQVFHIWGMWEVAAELNASAIEVARARDDSAAMLRLLTERAALLWPQGAHESAMRCAVEALVRGRAEGDQWAQAEALEQMGIADLVADRLREALGRFGEALALHREVHNRRGETEALNHQGIVLAQMGRFQEASEQFQEMLELQRRFGDLRGQIKALNNIGEVYSLQGQHTEARLHYEQALALLRKVGGRPWLAIIYNNLGNLERAEGEGPRALEHLRTAVKIYREIHDRTGEADSLINIGLTYQSEGRQGEAVAHFALADEITQLIGDRYQHQRVLAATARTQWLSHQNKAALATYQEALKVAEELNRPYEQAQALEAVAELVSTTSDSDSAHAYWHRALVLYEGIGATAQAESVRGRLG